MSNSAPAQNCAQAGLTATPPGVARRREHDREYEHERGGGRVHIYAHPAELGRHDRADHAGYRIPL